MPTCARAEATSGAPRAMGSNDQKEVVVTITVEDFLMVFCTDGFLQHSFINPSFINQLLLSLLTGKTSLCLKCAACLQLSDRGFGHTVFEFKSGPWDLHIFRKTAKDLVVCSRTLSLNA